MSRPRDFTGFFKLRYCHDPARNKTPHDAARAYATKGWGQYPDREAWTAHFYGKIPLTPPKGYS